MSCDRSELERRVNLVFSTLQTDLGMAAAFRFEFPADQPEKLQAAKRSWFRPELAKVPGKSFDFGLRRIGSEWQAGRQFKSLPSFGDFLALCAPRAEELNMPTEDAAWREAVAGCVDPEGWAWSHEAVLLAATAVGFWDLRQGAAGADVLRRRFSNAYAQLLQRLARGEELVKPMQALEWDGVRNPAELADMVAEQELQERMRRDGLADAGQGARAVLLAKLGIRREMRA